MTDHTHSASPVLDPAHTICFTGHRPQSLGGFAPNPTQAWVRQALAEAIDTAIDHGYTTFISGMALGVDTWAAIEVLNRRDCGARLVAAVPFAGQETLWPAEARRVYDFILGEAELLHVVSDGAYAPAKMHVRDKWMVDHAARMIAVWTAAPMAAPSPRLSTPARKACRCSSSTLPSAALSICPRSHSLGQHSRFLFVCATRGLAKPYKRRALCLRRADRQSGKKS